MKNKPLIHVGTFNKPHGLKGEIKIIMHLGDFKLFQSLSPFLINDEEKIYNVEYIKFIKGKIIGKLLECNERNCAELLRNKKIFVKKSEFPETEKKYLYTLDLINCDVKTKDKILLGKIISIDNFGAGDLMNVKNTQDKSFYIPMNDDNLVNVDLKKRTIIVNPIKGIIN